MLMVIVLLQRIDDRSQTIRRIAKRPLPTDMHEENDNAIHCSCPVQIVDSRNEIMRKLKADITDFAGIDGTLQWIVGSIFQDSI